MDKNFLLGVGVANATCQEILEYILQSLEKKGENYYVVTPNPEILVYAGKHEKFKTILNNARLALPDGIGVIWGGKILGQNFHERVTGVDFLEELCRRCSEKPITVGFLGGGPKIAERVAECLMDKYKGLNVVFAAEEWGGDGFVQASHDRFTQIRKQINTDDPRESARNPRKSIDILFVAFGFPKQEEWMSKHLNKIPARVMIGVGGSFDYISGNVLRAPRFIQSIGLEWLFRLIVQPWRFKRQLALFDFIYLVLKEKLNKNCKRH